MKVALDNFEGSGNIVCVLNVNNDARRFIVRPTL